MHILILGVPGTGKSYLTGKMNKKGINAVDASCFTKLVDSKGRKATYDPNAGMAQWSTHYQVVDKRSLNKLLERKKTAYFFCFYAYGQPGKRNGIFDVLDLFDKIYYLNAPKKVIADRVKNRSKNRPTRFGKNPEELKMVFDMKKKLDKRAKALGFQFVDTTLPAEKIIKIITS